MSPPDLGVVDDAYGPFADLYSDVLRVSVVATHEQIQLAYFDRRSELFTLLAKIDTKEQTEEAVEERFQAERKMDAVVLAVRILGDAEQRLTYDKIRQERLLNRRRATQGQLPGHEADIRATSGLDSVDEHDEHKRGKRSSKKDRKRDNNRDKKEKRKKSGSERKSSRTENSNSPPPSARESSKSDHSLSLDRSKETVDTEHLTEDDDSPRDTKGYRSTRDEDRQDADDATYQTELASAASGKAEERSDMLSCITNSRILRNISDEISGACEDALVSVDQVFNAFTLTDKDIRAVTRRIDKAKQQFDN